VEWRVRPPVPPDAALLPWTRLAIHGTSIYRCHGCVRDTVQHVGRHTDWRHEELIGGELTGLDPFVDSGEAVEAWKQGDFESLILHNVADIRRTRELMQLAERYCSKSHFTMRSLDPVA
jgi:hypothetical protein